MRNEKILLLTKFCKGNYNKGLQVTPTKMKRHEDQKITALTLIAEGMKIADISKQLNIPASTLYRWKSDPKPQKFQEPNTQKFQEPNTQYVEELTTKLSELELRLTKLEKHNQRAFQKQQDYEEPKKLQFNLR